MAIREDSQELVESKYHLYFQVGKERGLGKPQTLLQTPVKSMEQNRLENISKHIKDMKVIWSSQHRFTNLILR